ncbi:MAG TPA: acyltransferase [Terriglobales bacterium]|nr:acyltransferase [Terriglobales bacterium]
MIPTVKRIPSLDGLRAISISMVVVGHIAYSGHAPRFLSQYANLGVRIFFVISGYLITTILLGEHSRTGTISLRDFYIRRAYRIFPAAMFFILMIVLLYWQSLRWYDIGAALLYLVNFDPFRPWVIGHLWSLSVEEQFYFLWPSVLKKWYQHRMIILCAVILAAPIARTFLFFLKVGNGGYGNLLTVGDNLATGCLLAMLGPRMREIPWKAAALMLVAMLLIPLYDADSRLRTVFMLFILSPILHFSIAGILLHVVQHPYRLLNLPPMVWLGNISYSLYLWQQPFFDPSSSSRYGVLWAVGLACVSYYLIERPMLRARDRIATISKYKAETIAA